MQDSFLSKWWLSSVLWFKGFFTILCLLFSHLTLLTCLLYVSTFCPLQAPV